MFHFAKTAKTLMTRRFSVFVHQPFRLKIKGKIPESAGVEDMATKLWRVNPGLVVAISSVGTFMIGMGVHLVTRATSVNTSLEHALADEASAKKAQTAAGSLSLENALVDVASS